MLRSINAEVARFAQSPGRLGGRMAALFRRWDGQAAIDLSGLAECLLARLGAADSPVGQACLAVAAAVSDWGGLPYHSARHHAEVATNAAILAALASQPVAAHGQAVLLAAAFAHDYQYVSGPQGRFAAEARSAAAMDAIASWAGVGEADREAIRTLILATEPGCRGALAACQPALPAELALLATRPDLAVLARILSDADLLSSAGLTLRWHEVQVARLAREAGRPLSPSDNRAFFDHVVGQGFISPGGAYFAPNLARIRQAVQQRASRDE